jgi:thymidylate kinase
MTFLFTFEGIDGSGKSTLISNLKTLPNLNLVTSSWRDTELGKKI